MDSRNTESEGICQGCTRRTRWLKPAITHGVKTHSNTFHFRGKNCEEQTETSEDTFCAELNRMNAYKSGDPGLSPSKRKSHWRWFKMLLFFKLLRILQKLKATCNFNLSNLMESQWSLKKTAALLLTTISLLNAVLLTIQYTQFNTHTTTIGEVSVVCPAKGKA
jgi:hypothetical protein